MSNQRRCWRRELVNGRAGTYAARAATRQRYRVGTRLNHARSRKAVQPCWQAHQRHTAREGWNVHCAGYKPVGGSHCRCQPRCRAVVSRCCRRLACSLPLQRAALDAQQYRGAPELSLPVCCMLYSEEYALNWCRPEGRPSATRAAPPAIRWFVQSYCRRSTVSARPCHDSGMSLDKAMREGSAVLGSCAGG